MNNSMLSDRIEKFILEMLGKRVCQESCVTSNL